MPKENGEIEAQKDIDEMEEERRYKEQIGDEKGVIGAEIVEAMEKAYIDYSMSVIVQRAIPSVEDGLKPVHRRILYAMHKMGLDLNKVTRKSAKIVGETMGTYHPHGNLAIYDSLVRMAQDFSLRYPLVHGQGNFGSMDGDPPGADRYTEAKLSKISEELLADIEKDTVTMIPNFDNSTKEPLTLPAKLPNLLLMGTTGIAVGMATNIPPHNLNEVCDAIISLIQKPEQDNKSLMQNVTGPDFPTGGIISSEGLASLYETGKGRIVIRAKTTIDEKKGKPVIIISEIPYMVNKAELVATIAKLATEKKITDLADIRDESSRGKVRVVIELKKGANAKFTLNKLYKLTRLQDRFDANMLALVNQRPHVLTLKDILTEYIKYRTKIVTNRSKYDLQKAEDRLEIVLGFLIALKSITEIIQLIRKSKNTQEAHDGLMQNYKLSSRQAKAILDMRLSQLTALESTKLEEEEKKLNETIIQFQKILGSEKEILNVIKKELQELKKQYGDSRKTHIVRSFNTLQEKDLVEKKDVVITLTNSGYIKRIDTKTYKEQGRGGSGSSGTGLKDEDFVTNMLSCSTHDYLLFFTSRGRVFWLKTNDIPDATRQSKGRSIANLLQLRDEKIANVRAINNFENSDYLMFATQLGIVKKLPLKDLAKPRSTGVRIMSLPLDGSDTIINVCQVKDKQEVLLTTKKGQAIRFNTDDVRSMGRASYGVRGIDLKTNDAVVALVPLINNTETILTISEKGYGKRSAIEDYRKTSRGGKGVINLKVGERSGNIISSLCVDNKDSVIITTTKGMVIRITMKQMRVMGRATQGVRIVKLKPSDKVADIVKVPREEEVIEKKIIE